MEDANKGNFPDGTKVDVGDDGTATITYPDQTKSTDTIPGDKLVEGKDSGSTSGQTDADKITPKVPDKKVPVGADGTATITYPDTTTDTIEGSKLVRPATDAEKTTPKVPETKEPVANTSSLTEGEKAKVQKNVEDANKGNFPD
ncbi:surface protein Rib, partial [Limosilactobacillus reuteri]